MAEKGKLPEEKDRPWHVRIKNKEQTLHSGHMTEQLASRRCDEANKQAERLGISARYFVSPKGK